MISVRIVFRRPTDSGESGSRENENFPKSNLSFAFSLGFSREDDIKSGISCRVVTCATRNDASLWTTKPVNNTTCSWKFTMLNNYREFVTRSSTSFNFDKLAKKGTSMLLPGLVGLDWTRQLDCCWLLMTKLSHRWLILSFLFPFPSRSKGTADQCFEILYMSVF